MTSSVGSTSNSYLDSLGINNASATTGTSNSSSSSAASSVSGQLDENAFLKLMTTQLQTQDPESPTDSSQMVAQLAQFSQVAGISEMNDSLKNITSLLTANNSRIGDASNWIGRAALVNSPIATPLGDGTYAGQISLPSDASNVSVSLVDSTGATVNTQTLGAQSKGNVNFMWNGKDANGNQVATGPLKIVVNATGANGAITPTTAAWTTITSVQSPASGSDTQLVTPLGNFAPSDALSLG
jgi:flagellar basal-body rod modification protein FlgD